MNPLIIHSLLTELRYATLYTTVYNASLITKLNSKLKSAIRVSYDRGRSDDVFILLKRSLGKIIFTLISCLLVHQCVHNAAPDYFKNLVIVSCPAPLLLYVPRVRTKIWFWSLRLLWAEALELFSYPHPHEGRH